MNCFVLNQKVGEPKGLLKWHQSQCNGVMSVIHMTVSSPYDKLMLKIHAKEPYQKAMPKERTMPKGSHVKKSS